MNDLEMASPPPLSSNAFSPGANTNSSLHDFLAQQARQFGDHTHADYDELLAEFTASPAAHLLSPAALHSFATGPGGLENMVGTPHASGGPLADLGAYAALDIKNSLSPEDLVLERSALAFETSIAVGDDRRILQGAYDFGAALGSPVGAKDQANPHLTGLGPSGLGHGEPRDAGSMQLAQAIASMDGTTKSQLLAALMAQHQQPPGVSVSANGSSSSSLSPARSPLPSAPTTEPQQLLRRPLHPSGTRSHPQSRSGSVHLPSPQQSFHPSQPQQQHYPVPPPVMNQHRNGYQPSQHHTAINTALPPSIQTSPMSSPYQTNNVSHEYYPAQQPHPHQYSQAQQFVPGPVSLLHLQEQQHNLSNSTLGHSSPYRSAFSPRPFVPRRESHHDASNPGSRRTSEQPTDAVPELRGASATGGSYATTADDDEWRENPEFLFSPLMSPALTPHTNISQASPYPCLPSGSLHSNMNLISPAEIFSPLGSPAIMPQSYHTDLGNANWQLHQQGQPHLQGLVDQTKALGFESVHASPTGYIIQQSPRLGATMDAGGNTAAGSGRRGAGSKKARPSPLLKPTPDGALRRKKGNGSISGPAGGSERKGGSIGSGGGNSTTTSPFLGPSHSHNLVMTSAPSTQFSSKTTSPAEVSSNTPSPVDLAMHYAQAYPSSQQLSANGENVAALTGFMGPPPVPSNVSSRRSSLVLAGAPEWLNPVTPATFMNLAPTNGSGGMFSSETYDYSLDPAQQQHLLNTSHPLQQIDPALGGAGDTNMGKRKPVVMILPGGESEASSSTTVTPGAKGKGKAVVQAAKKVRPAKVVKPKAATEAAPAKTKKAELDLDISTNTAASSHMPSSISIVERGPAGADSRRTSHKAAEQKRRDSLKLCFEELRRILPPLAQSNEDDRRPGEGNVGGQRGGSVDPENPNRGVSKVALLRRSNEYVGILDDRIKHRDLAIDRLRSTLLELRLAVGQGALGDMIEGLDLDNLDVDEKKAGTMAYYENYSDEEQEGSHKTKPAAARKKAGKRKTAANVDGDFAPTGKAGARRSTRKTNVHESADDSAMEVEGEEYI